MRSLLAWASGTWAVIILSSLISTLFLCRRRILHMNVISVLLILMASECCILLKSILYANIVSILLHFLMVLLWLKSLLSNRIYVDLTAERQGAVLIFLDGYLASCRWVTSLSPHNSNIILNICGFSETSLPLVSRFAKWECFVEMSQRLMT